MIPNDESLTPVMIQAPSIQNQKTKKVRFTTPIVTKSKWLCPCTHLSCQERWKIIKDATVSESSSDIDDVEKNYQIHQKYKNRKQKIQSSCEKEEDEIEEKVSETDEIEVESNKKQTSESTSSLSLLLLSVGKDEKKTKTLKNQKSEHEFPIEWQLYHCKCHFICFGRQSLLCRICKSWRCRNCIFFNNLPDGVRKDQNAEKNVPLCETCLQKYYVLYKTKIGRKRAKYAEEEIILERVIDTLTSLKPQPKQSCYKAKNTTNLEPVAKKAKVSEIFLSNSYEDEGEDEEAEEEVEEEDVNNKNNDNNDEIEDYLYTE